MRCHSFDIVDFVFQHLNIDISLYKLLKNIVTGELPKSVKI